MIREIIRTLRRTPKDRFIFRFVAGGETRFADPVDASLLLIEHPEYLPSHLAEARAGDLDAIEVCGRAACDAFGLSLVTSNSKHGVTLAECVKLLLAFDLWQVALRHKHDAFCRLAVLHGCDIGSLDPERFCALYFSRHDSQVRIAENLRLGARVVNAELPLSWFIATRDTIDEARNAHDVHVASIASARQGAS